MTLPKPCCKAYRELPESQFSQGKPSVLITGSLFSFQGFHCKTLYFPVRNCRVECLFIVPPTLFLLGQLLALCSSTETSNPFDCNPVFFFPSTTTEIKWMRVDPFFVYVQCLLAFTWKFVQKLACLHSQLHSNYVVFTLRCSHSHAQHACQSQFKIFVQVGHSNYKKNFNSKTKMQLIFSSDCFISPSTDSKQSCQLHLSENDFLQLIIEKTLFLQFILFRQDIEKKSYRVDLYCQCPT